MWKRVIKVALERVQLLRDEETLVALAAAPLVTPIVIWVKVVASEIVSGSFTVGGALEWAYLIALLYTPFAYLITALLGVPLLVLFRKLHVESWYSYAIAGAAIGFLSRFVFSPFMFTDWSNVAEDLWLMLCGLCSSLTFWMLVYWRRTKSPSEP
ncbi:MAG: hypothetical protein AABO41_07195 [Acidobacteriota bacterium]